MSGRRRRQVAGIKEAAVPVKVGVIECFGSSHIRPVYENVGLLCTFMHECFMYELFFLLFS